MENIKELIAQEIEKQRRSSNMLVMTIKEEPSDKELIEACANLANKFIKAPFKSSMKVMGSESVDVYTLYYDHVKVRDLDGNERVFGETKFKTTDTGHLYNGLQDLVEVVATNLYETLKQLGKEAVVVIHMKPSEL